MEVKVLSKENIMPSSPTPPHLKTFQLSLLDQFSPVLYAPLIIFYTMDNKDDPRHHQSHEKLMATLKSSLSKTLSHFYLLAGRIVDKSICCSDEGAVFIEATVSCSMSEILKQPNNEFLMKLVPCSERCTKPIEEYAHVIVQVNVFDCGGIAISLCLLHKLMDATTIGCFLKCWATINKRSFATTNLTIDNGASELFTPPSSMTNDDNSDPFSKMVCYDYKELSSLFPQTNFLPFHPRLHEALSSNCEEKSSFQRFVFKEKAILDLKAKAKSNDVPNPTSVEVLSGFIWKCALEAASTKLGLSQIPSILTHAVNLRKRMEPPLPEFSVGNIFWNVVAHYLADKKTQVELSELVSLIRQSFVDINGNYIKRIVGNEGSEALVKLVWERNMKLFQIPKLYICTSWRNMDLSEVNFGWGKPVWIGSAGNSNTTIKNMIVLLDAISNDGVEAWVILEEEEMQILLQNQEFFNFALLNPPIPI
ncbi:BAHD acyltransferase BIA1 [Cucumis sativus]|uniref:Salutaridinol 7-O-acetyltransferase n=1 Tax=Cucumis sativus TaxID=3659 RepID=A0A0A0KW67_CUCSA|nr:BAHD acyltransferase BIA1 [Cucumis sativus]